MAGAAETNGSSARAAPAETAKKLRKEQKRHAARSVRKNAVGRTSVLIEVDGTRAAETASRASTCRKIERAEA
jgi:hypothetical protein